MTFNFYFLDDIQAKELFNILQAENKRHFNECGHIFPYTRPLESKNFEETQVGYTIDIPDNLYFEDIEKMKESVRSQFLREPVELIFNDFYEDVMENLSFVPKIEIY